MSPSCKSVQCKLFKFLLARLNLRASATPVCYTYRPLDRDAPTGQARWHLTVKATDGQHTAATEVVVNLKDVNDNAPVFPRDIVMASVLENSPAGTIVADVPAYDADDPNEGSNARLAYSLQKNVIDESSGRPMFVVDRDTGTLRTAVCCLDREHTATFGLVLAATDGGGLQGTCLVNVQIEDVNDVPPSFVRSRVTVSIAEYITPSVRATPHAASAPRPSHLNVASPVGTAPSSSSHGELVSQKGRLSSGRNNASANFITLLAVDDPDTTNVFAFRVVPESGRGWQLVEVFPGRGGGEVYTRVPLDFENPQHRGGLSFRVQVTDQIHGNADSGSYVFHIHLAILQNNFLHSLDHVIRPADIRTSCYATDICTSCYATDIRTSCYATDIRISCYATDIRTSCYATDVCTSCYATDVCTSCYATDICTSCYASGVCTSCYAIGICTSCVVSDVCTSCGTPDACTSCCITAAYTAGAVVLRHKRPNKQTMMPEADIMSLYANSAGDLPWSSNPRVSECAVVVEVQDVNDNAPVFTTSSTDQSVLVAEDLPLYSYIASVGATDLDTGASGLVKYGISGTSDPGGLLSVDGAGAVVLNRRLDREASSLQVVHVLAWDNGDPPLTGTATLTVERFDELHFSDAHLMFATTLPAYISLTLASGQVISIQDVNDNPPFLAGGSTVRLSEGMDGALPSGATVPFSITVDDLDDWSAGHGPPFSIIPRLEEDALFTVKFFPGRASASGGVVVPGELLTLQAVSGPLSVPVMLTDAGTPPLQSQLRLTLVPQSAQTAPTEVTVVKTATVIVTGIPLPAPLGHLPPLLPNWDGSVGTSHSNTNSGSTWNHPNTIASPSSSRNNFIVFGGKSRPNENFSGVSQNKSRSNNDVDGNTSDKSSTDVRFDVDSSISRYKEHKFSTSEDALIAASDKQGAGRDKARASATWKGSSSGIELDSDTGLLQLDHAAGPGRHEAQLLMSASSGATLELMIRADVTRVSAADVLRATPVDIVVSATDFISPDPGSSESPLDRLLNLLNRYLAADKPHASRASSPDSQDTKTITQRAIAVALQTVHSHFGNRTRLWLLMLPVRDHDKHALEGLIFQHQNEVERELAARMVGAGVTALGDCASRRSVCSCCCRDNTALSQHWLMVDAGTRSYTGPSLYMESTCKCPSQGPGGSEATPHQERGNLASLTSAHAVTAVRRPPCGAHVCLNGGKCMPAEAGKPKCVCPGNTFGPRCKILSRHFGAFAGSGLGPSGGSTRPSFVLLPPLPTCSKLHLTVYVLTQHKDGVILSSRSGVDQVERHFTLLLWEGRPRLTMRSSAASSLKTLTVQKKITDFMWHRLDVVWVNE
ncbi:Cadherin, partial [Trinorchestia longiramus]